MTARTEGERNRRRAAVLDVLAVVFALAGIGLGAASLIAMGLIATNDTTIGLVMLVGAITLHGYGEVLRMRAVLEDIADRAGERS